MDNLHPVMQLALLPFAPPARTPQEEASWVSADLAEAQEKQRPDYEQRRADRIERRDAALVQAMSTPLVPGDRL